MEIVTPRRARFIQIPALRRPGFIHAFGTIDLGRSAPNAHAAIKAAFPEIKEIVTLHQVHGTTPVVVNNIKDAARLRGSDADIVIVNAPGIAATVRTADCAPVLVIDPRRKVAAAAHAGWRGTAKGVAARAVGELCERFGSKPNDLIAGIGPCVGPCHYQVDSPVIEGIIEAIGDRACEVLAKDGHGKARLDLSLANRIILEDAGLKTERIHETRSCTYRGEDLFFSYRRQGKGVPSLYHFVALQP